MNTYDRLDEKDKQIQLQQKIIDYYEDQMAQAMLFFWELTDNPYRTKELSDREIDEMRQFIEQFSFKYKEEDFI